MSDRQEQRMGESRLNEKEVAAYLREHPEFFLQQEALLAELNLPHTDTGQAISLIERQVSVLREQKNDLKRKLQHLAQVARSNENLLERMQRLILALIDSPDLDAVMDLLRRCLRDDFHADAVELRLFESGHLAAAGRPEFNAPDSTQLKAFERILSQCHPVCGYLSPEQRAYLFERVAGEVASGAVIPLCESEKDTVAIGLLGIGSIDPKRFHPEMGTVFLAHLGAVLTRVIKRHLGL